jgi:VWFA-related protein
LVVDNSASMRASRDEVVAAGLTFARSSNPLDQMFVVNFRQTANLGLPPTVPYTSNIEQLDAALSNAEPAGNTALYDGIALALEHLRTGTRGRKALIVVSDGEDNSSQLRLPELMKRVQASSITIDTIGLANPGQTDKNLEVLKRLARATGGTAYFPRSVSEVTAVCQDIARAIRHQYTLGYTPTGDDANDRYHAIRVTAKAKGMSGLRVYTRAGYQPS